MARFYSGQRVRIANNPDVRPGLEGREGVFKHYGPPSWIRLAAPDDCVIELSDGIWGAAAKNLEPIVPEGHQVISWEEMADLWTPEKVEV